MFKLSGFIVSNEKDLICKCAFTHGTKWCGYINSLMIIWCSYIKSFDSSQFYDSAVDITYHARPITEEGYNAYVMHDYYTCFYIDGNTIRFKVYRFVYVRKY